VTTNLATRLKYATAPTPFRLPKPFVPSNQVQPLSVAAYRIVEDRMEQFGNKLSATHREALMRTVGMFSHIALGAKTGRVAVSMATGCGKSLSAVAWLAAVHRMGLDIGVVIAASQVESLASLIRDLKTLGVPDEKIGLIHSKRYSPEPQDDRFASMEATEGNEDRQFLFVTHSRINAAANDADKEGILTTYKGRKRNLCI